MVSAGLLGQETLRYAVSVMPCSFIEHLGLGEAGARRFGHAAPRVLFFLLVVCRAAPLQWLTAVAESCTPPGDGTRLGAEPPCPSVGLHQLCLVGPFV